MRILVSACLLGMACRYDGQAKTYPLFDRLSEKYELIPFCPEIFGGLPTPRDPAEQKDGRVLSENGRDVTENYQKGAREALYMARLMDCRVAVLKSKSPSCGKGRIYDGTFTRTLREGMGVTAALLSENGIRILDETELQVLL